MKQRFNAAAAAQLADVINGAVCNQTIDNILEMVELSTALGKYECVWRGSLNELTQDTLEKLGFSVSIGSDLDNTSVTVVKFPHVDNSSAGRVIEEYIPKN